jgi:MraZ protein
MDRFVSNFTHRLDSKGRVSIPATFRAVLARDGFEGLYVHPALDAPALDAGGNMLLAGIDAFLSTLPPYSDERDHLSTALFGTSEILKVDPEGRVILTESVKAHAGVGEAVTFVGLGTKFQIWEPDRFRAHLEEARAKVRDLKRSFGAQGGTGVAQDIPPGARGR